MTDAVKRGRNNRIRGQTGEREVCALIHDYLGMKVKRNLGQERDSGTDIHVGPFRIEVKRRKAVAGLYQWLAQAHDHSLKPLGGPWEIPAVALRADGKGWLVVMHFHDWVTLAREEIAAAE